MALCSTSWRNFRRCTMILLTLSTFLLASFALPLHSNDDSVAQVTCTPADFKSVLLFFFANYAVHAATVPSVAGCFTISLLWIIGSLFYPFSGLIRSITLLFYYTITKDQIGKAISQGAVMVAARSTDWVPRFTHDELIYVRLNREFPENTDRAELPKAKFRTLPDIYSTSDAVKTKHYAINGEAKLPKGYFWSKPEITQLNALASLTLDREDIRVERTKSLVKGLASVAQLVFSSITLYRTRGPQIQQYGYAAFGLSVFPYALMSFVNLIVVTIVGEYPTLFILRTAISDEAKRCGGRISGEIGTPIPSLPVPEKSESPVDTPCTRSAGIISGTGVQQWTVPVNRDLPTYLPTPLPKVEDSNDGTLLGKRDVEEEHLLEEAAANETTTTLLVPEATGKDIETDSDEEENHYGSQAEKPLIPAKIRVEDGGVLVITMKGRTGRFKLIERYQKADDSTFHFHVSAVTNQEKVLKREDQPVTFTHLNRSYYLFFTILAIFPYVFIFLLTGFRKGNSTPAERGWMMSWLVFSQISTFFGFEFSTDDDNFMARPWAAGCFIIIILIFSTPAIGGFVTVGKMVLKFGTCSIS